MEGRDPLGGNFISSMVGSGEQVEETSERLLAALKAEKEELESSLSKEKLQTLQLKQDLTDAEARNTDLYKVDVAELRQKLDSGKLKERTGATPTTESCIRASTE